MTAWSVTEAERQFRDVEMRGRDAEIARDIVAELQSRLRFLDKVGLSYLSLDRAAPTLSGGEAQRIRLGVAARFESARRVLHPRRTDHRAASARQSDVARHAARTRSQGQHRRRRRAR